MKVLRIFLILIGTIIAIQCLYLMLSGKLNFGTIVPLLIGIIFVIHGVYWQTIQRVITAKIWLKRLWYLLWGLFIAWLISFVVFMIMLKQQIDSSKQIPTAINAIIVLGSGTVNGEPTPTLASRLDTAATIIQSHYAPLQQSPLQSQTLVITAGGVGFGRQRSEADIMATYLHDQYGFAKNRIIQEGLSTSTEENLANSKAILRSHGVSLDDPIVIVTSDFHTIRAKAIAKRLGYTQPVTVASPTPLSNRYNAWFREYFAFISGWMLDEY